MKTDPSKTSNEQATSLKTAFNRAAGQQGSKIPEAIRKDAPRPTLEMKGPDGQAVRRQAFNARLARDQQTARKVGLQNFRDKVRADPVPSKKEGFSVGQKNSITPTFNKAHGSKLGISFNLAKGRSTGR